MSDKYFVDTNILAYAHDTDSGSRHAKALALVEKLWLSGEGVVSTQVLQELSVFIRRKASRPMSDDEAYKVIEEFRIWEVVENNLDSILGAIKLEARYQISFWDALMLQAAMKAGATIVYSEDLADGQKYGAVRAVNPLKN
jgi:predicted nucleic acid-binding protein